VPVVVSTSASRVYSGPLLPALQDALPGVKAIERKNMNVWDGTRVRAGDDLSGLNAERARVGWPPGVTLAAPRYVGIDHTIVQ